MLAKQSDAFRQQDGQILFAPGEGKLPHPEWRWQKRAPEGLEDFNVRAAWREGRPVSWPGDGGYARLHEETGMLLVADYGCIVTVVRVGDAVSEPDDELVRQYKEGMLDG